MARSLFLATSYSHIHTSAKYKNINLSTIHYIVDAHFSPVKTFSDYKTKQIKRESIDAKGLTLIFNILSS